MKRVYAIIITVLLTCVLAFAQNGYTRVVLKNGVSLSGRLVEVNPLSHLIINISGVETRIPMSEVVSIEEEGVMQESASPSIRIDEFHEDLGELPETVMIQIGDSQMEMILIRGGDFMMGFDGRHSRDYRSEPVHPVRLSSFYVSKAPLSRVQAKFLSEKKLFLDYAGNHSLFRTWSKANELALKAAEKTGIPLRMITEAEWEYIAVSQKRDELDWYEEENDWCLDFYESEYFNSSHIQENPIGPTAGRGHVIRQWDTRGNAMYARKDGYMSEAMCCVRLVLPAAEYAK